MQADDIFINVADYILFQFQLVSIQYYFETYRVSTITCICKMIHAQTLLTLHCVSIGKHQLDILLSETVVDFVIGSETSTCSSYISSEIVFIAMTKAHKI